MDRSTDIKLKIETKITCEFKFFYRYVGEIWQNSKSRAHGQASKQYTYYIGHADYEQVPEKLILRV